MSSSKNDKDDGFHRKSVHKSVFPRRSQSSSNYNTKSNFDIKLLPLLKGTIFEPLKVFLLSKLI